MDSFRAIGQQQSTTSISTSDTSAFRQPRPASGSGTTFSQPIDPILDPRKAECIEELLRKSLLGEELVDTQFHLFSARSTQSGHVTKPRIVYANNALLAQRSKYFLDLLSSDINPSDPSLIDVTGDDDIPSSARMDNYGYDSDSDIDDCGEPVLEALKDPPISPSKVSAETQLTNSNELSAISNQSSSKTTVQKTLDDKRFGNQSAMHLRSLQSCHVLVKDTAFQTWYTLLNYLYTGKISFLPLSSTTAGGHHGFSTSALDEPRCSAKSMYRLASKVGCLRLRDQAFSYIPSNLSEHNILKEISCSLVSKYPQLLEMELNVLYSYIASPLIIVNFAAFAQRAHKELPHGADIMVGIHMRIVKEHLLLSLKLGPPASPESVKAEDKTGPCQVDT
ncbi:hypothetical protein OG21DRAFT_1490677 [Imleria badia]|nr:hypothetical protein OG21DRAFT_1490677 [Imleria badia]